MSATGVLLVALAIAIGLVGIVVPILPGALLVYAAIRCGRSSSTPWRRGSRWASPRSWSGGYDRGQVHLAGEADARRRRADVSAACRCGAGRRRVLRHPVLGLVIGFVLAACIWLSWRRRRDQRRRAGPRPYTRSRASRCRSESNWPAALLAAVDLGCWPCCSSSAHRTCGRGEKSARISPSARRRSARAEPPAVRRSRRR